jgi:hypothetical protein
VFNVIASAIPSPESLPRFTWLSGPADKPLTAPDAPAGLESPNLLDIWAMFWSTSAAGEAKRLASRLRFFLRIHPESQATLTFKGSRGSHRQAVHQHATLPLRPFLATIVLSLALVGLAAKALIPSFVDNDAACKVFDDSGNATTDDTDDDGKPAPQTDSTCKCGDFAKAILVTLDLVLPHTLMPVHALAVSDAATEALLPDHFLPNAETGPPVRLCSSPRACLFLSHPPQKSPIVLAAAVPLSRAAQRRNSV